MVEVGEQKIAEFVGEFMVDDDPNLGNRAAKEAAAKTMITGVEKAAGSKFLN